jgi:predicted PurR-regulated permease PerM
MNRPRIVLAAVVGVLLSLVVAFVLPFLNYFLLAVLLTYVLWPLQGRLATRVGARFAAGVIVLVATVTIVVPTVYVVRMAFDQARDLVVAIRAGRIGFDAIELTLAETFGLQIDVSQAVNAAINGFGLTTIDDVLSIVGTAAHVLLGVGLTVFLLYYFLKDGDRFLDWMERRMPLRTHVRRELFGEIRRITRAVLMGHVLVALVQGLIAGAGLALLGVPNAAFWTVLMVVLAVLPIIGSFLVWGPAVGWLALTGRPIAALALLVYGTIVVGVSDDYLRPIVVDRYAQINPAAIMIGVVGGIYVIGFMGIFFGPVVVGALKASVDIYDAELADTGG